MAQEKEDKLSLTQLSELSKDDLIEIQGGKSLWDMIVELITGNEPRYIEPKS